MQIIEANNRKFIVTRTINLERFESPQKAEEFCKGELYLRQNNSNNIFFVDEIMEATFEDIPLTTTPEVTPSIPEPYSEPSLGVNVDMKI